MGELEVAIVMYAVIGLCTLLYGWLKSRMLYWRRLGIPCEEPQFLVGNVKDVGVKRHFYEPLREVYDKFKGTGPFCGFYMLVQPVALVMDLDLVKNILIKDFQHFENRAVFHNAKDDPLTGHLFNLEGSLWKNLRTKLSPTFTSGKMKQMFPLVVQVANDCREVLDDMLRVSKEVDVKELMARYTTDVIGTCAFGLQCNSLKDPEAEFRVMNREMFTKFRHPKIVHAFMHTFPALAKRLRMREMLNETDKFYFRIVRETVEYREKNNVKRNDFMNMMIEMKNSKNESERLNMREITANAFLFFVAGFETSSTTLSFALYELAKNQRVQDKLRQEICDTLEKYQGEITYEATQEMKYLEQVIMETLRKYSVLPQLQRRAEVDYPTDIPGYVIRKGTLVYIPVDAIQHDPEIYPEPEKFRPERFEPEEMQQRHSMAWLPFGDGPRNCIGMRFGKMQVRVLLISLLRDYRFTLGAKTPNTLPINVSLPLITPDKEVLLNVEKC
ncbi:probable cytochrome P450 6a21 [Musca vetustissima]|uniref:probable cytochrome P450 6a21 n=1 Tax=Musca vetustissima TaxID=27455 RepID=UPI002AB70B69|nr:probable cytochrome P450 6a21 [Musca vetustissima]